MSIHDETIIKGYDPVIMRRMLRYTRPYWMLVVGAVASLAIGTVADLLLPVLIQRSVDEQLIAHYTQVPEHVIDRREFSALNLDDAVVMGEATYVPDHRMVAVSGVARNRLVGEGLLEQQPYYVFDLTEPLLDAHGEALTPIIVDRVNETLPTRAAITVADLNSLPEPVRGAVRSADLQELGDRSRLFLLLLVAVLLFTFGQVYLMALTGQGVMKDLRAELFDHTMRQRLAYLSTHPVGRIVTRVTNDVETINQLFTEVLSQLLKNVGLMIGSLVTLLLLNWRLGLVTIATLPPVLIAALVFRRYSREAYRRVRVSVSKLNSFLSEHLSGMHIVQLFVQQRRTRKEFGRRNDQVLKAWLGEMYVFATFRPVIDLLSSTSIAVIIYFGAQFLLSGVVSLGVLIAFVNLIRRFYQPVMTIAEQYTILQGAMAGGERVFQMLDNTDRITDTGTRAADTGTGTSGSVEFRNVWFAYKEGEDVIRDLSFRAAPGEKIAIVGYTGAGKTTIANLLTRLWDIQAGSILLDGVDVREYSLNQLRTAMAPIQQDVFLFNDTVRNNVSLGLTISDTEIWRVLEMVQADRFVKRLPGGLDASLTEGATNISTGERQLLSFARILAHDPRILIMDEATSNIDTETEQRIQQAIETVMEGRTALVIAHRLSTIKNANRILVLAHGKLVEEGSHAELIDRGGIYYNLYRLQYQSADR